MNKTFNYIHVLIVENVVAKVHDVLWAWLFFIDIGVKIIFVSLSEYVKEVQVEAK